MKNLLDKIKSFYKGIIKKLNNFRLTAFIVSVVSLVAGITTLGILFCYYFAGDIWETTNAHVPSFMQLGADNGQIYGKIMGMIFFLCSIVVIGLSIAAIYNALPALKNKEKVSPKRSVLMFAFVNGCFQIVVLVFSILAITLEQPKSLAGYIVTLPFTIVTLIANLLCIVPFLKCIFYQPKIGTPLFAKKENMVEAKAE